MNFNKIVFEKNYVALFYFAIIGSVVSYYPYYKISYRYKNKLHCFRIKVFCSIIYNKKYDVFVEFEIDSLKKVKSNDVSIFIENKIKNLIKSIPSL